jgi:hypothetical protein
MISLNFIASLLIRAVGPIERDRRVARAIRRVPGNRLKPRGIEILIAELDQIAVARAVVHVEVAFLDFQIQSRPEQVFDLPLLALKKLLIGFDLFVFAPGYGRFKESRRWKLARIARDHHAMRPRQHRQRLLEPALRGFIENHHIEQRSPRKDLRNRLRAGHPDGA